LAAAICKLISMGSDALADVGLRARRRVRELFDLDAVTRRYEAVYDELLERDLNGNSSSAVGGIVKREQVPV
jgi:glycosyltransferase involved in cell wall biosynthesis